MKIKIVWRTRASRRRDNDRLNACMSDDQAAPHFNLWPVALHQLRTRRRRVGTGLSSSRTQILTPIAKNRLRIIQRKIFFPIFFKAAGVFGEIVHFRFSWRLKAACIATFTLHELASLRFYYYYY